MTTKHCSWIDHEVLVLVGVCGINNAATQCSQSTAAVKIHVITNDQEGIKKKLMALTLQDIKLEGERNSCIEVCIYLEIS